jgi:SH3-like domain-containing protein
MKVGKINKKFLILLAVLVAVGFSNHALKQARRGTLDVAPPDSVAASASDALSKTIGAVTGLPIPRYASLARAQVNMRVGPGNQYPIEWTMTRRKMPVQIIDEFEVWRKVRDFEGVEGWVHSQMLSGRRSVIALKEGLMLRADHSFKAPPLARLQPTVVGVMDNCEKGWCFVRIQGYQGWVPHEYIWGVAMHEVY